MQIKMEKETKDITKRLSKSKLNCFDTCPKQYWFSQYYPEKATFSPAMARGSKLHSILDKLYKENISSIKSKQEIYKILKTISLSSEYDKELKLFCEWLEKLDYSVPESTEEKIYDDNEDIVIKWDRIDYDGKKRTLWDYKSGKLKPVSEFWFELGLYALIYMKKTNKPIHYVGIYFIDYGTYDMIEITDDFMKKVISRLYDLRTEMYHCQNINIWPIKKGFHCSWCQWKNLCLNK